MKRERKRSCLLSRGSFSSVEKEKCWEGNTGGAHSASVAMIDSLLSRLPNIVWTQLQDDDQSWSIWRCDSWRTPLWEACTKCSFLGFFQFCFAYSQLIGGFSTFSSDSQIQRCGKACGRSLNVPLYIFQPEIQFKKHEGQRKEYKKTTKYLCYTETVSSLEPFRKIAAVESKHPLHLQPICTVRIIYFWWCWRAINNIF